MAVSKARMEEMLRERFFGSRLFPAVRDTYQLFFSRTKLANRQAMRRFYANYVRKGDLVFDVGANVGVYTEVFAGLGARVVAIEPNPRCCQVLRQLARRLPIQLEMCAAGDRPGNMPLHICENHLLSALSDGSGDDPSSRSPLHRAARWTGTFDVPIKTLDDLASAHGTPTFVKIDAEGYDDRVLRGMSFQPATLSFEYYRYIPEIATRCLDAPVLADGYQFSYVQGVDMRTPSKWMSLSELKVRLQDLPDQEDYGDVIARRL
jgi:FkbM family methyltransferase